jgi:hypothetical protein
MVIEMVPRRARLLLALLIPVAACAKQVDSNPEFAAQGDALDTPAITRDDVAPATSSVRLNPPVDAGPATPVPTAAISAPTPGYAIAVCPLECHIADGPREIPLPQPEVDSLRSAFAPTMNGLRQCASSDGMENERHKPTLNLRFGSHGQLMDVGVDPTGWDGQVEDCMLQVVRGGAPSPQVSLDGPADVRCSERCERHGRWRTAPR